MGIRFSKRLKIAPGLHINASLKRGLSMSIGPKGATHNMGADGQRRTTVGVTGTGVSHVTYHRPSRVRGSLYAGLLLAALALVAFWALG